MEFNTKKTILETDIMMAEEKLKYLIEDKEELERRIEILEKQIEDYKKEMELLEFYGKND